jgi:hypothetical protein
VEMSAVDGAVTVTTYLTISLLGDDPEAIVDDATPGAETES